MAIKSVTSGASIVVADTSPYTEWENLDNLKTQDGNTTLAHAYAGGFGELTAPALKVSGFTFNIPNSASVVGVKLTTRRKSDFNGFNDYVADSVVYSSNSGVYLMKNSENITEDKSDTTKWSTSFEDKEYGGESDSWGVTLIGADVNDSSFGVSYRPYIVRLTEADVVAEIDYVSLTVYYEEWTNDDKNTSTITNTTKNSSDFYNDTNGTVQYLLKEDFAYLLLETGGRIIANGDEQDTTWTNDNKN